MCDTFIASTPVVRHVFAGTLRSLYTIFWSSYHTVPYCTLQKQSPIPNAVTNFRHTADGVHKSIQS